MATSLLAAGAAFAEDEAKAAGDGGKRSVLVLDLKASNTDPETTNLITELVAVSLQKRAVFDVLTSSDVRDVVAIESDRQALGCDEGSASCLAEVAGAMGADLVVTGTVGQLGSATLVTLNLFDSSAARSRGREELQVQDLATIRPEIDRAVGRLVSEFTGEVVPDAPIASPSEETASAAPSPFVSPLFLGGAAMAVALGGTSAGLGVWAFLEHEVLNDAGETSANKTASLATGTGAFWGSVATGVGAVVAVGIAAVPLVLE
jgi:hypothetical protein